MNIMISILFLLGTLSLAAMELPLYKSTNHFVFYCFEKDHAATDDLARVAEEHYTQMAQEWNHQLNNKIHYYVYPDIKSFHEAIGKPDAQDWLIGENKDKAFHRVSPANPGSFHSYESCVNASIVLLVGSFLHDIYGSYEDNTRWLYQGLGYYKAKRYSVERLRSKINDGLIVPTILELETLGSNDQLYFDRESFLVSGCLVDYMINRFGLPAIQRLLQDYSAFETIFGISKQELYASFMQSLDQQ